MATATCTEEEVEVKPSKELMAWIARWCCHRDDYGRCPTLSRGIRAFDAICPDEGRPDCPAILELSKILEKEVAVNGKAGRDIIIKDATR